MQTAISLRRISPAEIAKRYRSGEFKRAAWPPKVELPPANSSSKGAANGATYAFRDRIGNNVTMVAINAEWPRNIAPICLWCRQPLDAGTNPVGIPLCLTNYREGTPDSAAYSADGHYCCFECCLAEIERNAGMAAHYRDPMFAESAVLLRHIYAQLHPGKTLTPARNFRLLMANGGPLSSEAFWADIERTTYTNTGRIIFEPARVLFARQELKPPPGDQKRE